MLIFFGAGFALGWNAEMNAARTSIQRVCCCNSGNYHTGLCSTLQWCKTAIFTSNCTAILPVYDPQKWRISPDESAKHSVVLLRNITITNFSEPASAPLMKRQ